MYLLSGQSYPSTVYEMFRNLDRLLSPPLGVEFEAPFNSFCSGTLMTNLREEDDSFIVEMEVPGVKPEEVNVSMIGTELTVEIRREESKNEEPKEKKESKESKESKDEGRYLRRERCFESMVRTIDLPLESPPKDVEAGIKDGILCVKVRKPEPAKVKKIEITAN